jgi:hypothetical protein
MAMLINSGLILLLPSVVGVVVARLGTGRLLWTAAATALALAVYAWLSIVESHNVGGVRGIGPGLRGYLLSLMGLPVGIGVCVAELVRALRARQFAWFAALLAIGAVPLMASLAVFDYTTALLEQYTGGEPLAFQSELLAFQLLPIGPVILLAYGARVAFGARQPG